jgi:peroxiredoxin
MLTRHGVSKKNSNSMKFVLAIFLVLATTLSAYSQNPAIEVTTSSESLSLSELMVELDSLKSDPAFQKGMNELATGLLSSVGLAPDQILHQPLPDFSLTDLQGNTLTNEQLYGKVTFLLIWDVENRPSAETIRQLNQIRKAYRHQEVRFLALAAVPTNVLQRTLKNTTLDFQHLPAAYHLISELGYLPQSILVDRNGIVRYTTAGTANLLDPYTTDFPQLRELLNELLVE